MRVLLDPRRPATPGGRAHGIRARRPLRVPARALAAHQLRVDPRRLGRRPRRPQRQHQHPGRQPGLRAAARPVRRRARRRPERFGRRATSGSRRPRRRAAPPALVVVSGSGRVPEGLRAPGRGARRRPARDLRRRRLRVRSTAPAAPSARMPWSSPVATTSTCRPRSTPWPSAACGTCCARAARPCWPRRWPPGSSTSWRCRWCPRSSAATAPGSRAARRWAGRTASRSCRGCSSRRRAP